MSWEIFGYQNSDSLFGVLNSTAAISGSGTFAGALALVGFCGFVAAAVAYAFAPQKLQGWQWLATVLLVMSVLFVPKVTVGIVDKTGGSAVKIVDNVPFGLAVLGSLTSVVGNTMTELYEMAMQLLPGSANLPAELTYQQNGLLFGSRLIKETSRVVFPDPYVRTDVINFINNCTVYDLADGTLSPRDFANSANIWPLMGTPNPARFTSVADAAGTLNVVTCPAAYTSLNNRIPAEIVRIQGSLAYTLNPTLPAVAAASVIAGQIQQAYIKANIANAATTAADLIRQNALINAVNDTSLIVGQKINDPTSMLLAVGRAQAVSQTNASWINSGKLAEQALPVVRNVIEAVTYALFPLFVLLLLLTSGKETMTGFKNYAAVLIWIQLWPPLYSILNYMALVYSAKELAAASSIGTGLNALSLSTSSAIYSTAISGQAVVGWMTISVPFIAWAALKRMENFGMAIASGFTALQAATTAATGAASTGNVHMGNTSMDQIGLSPTSSSPFFSSRQNDVSGNIYTSNLLSGRTAVKALANEGPASHMIETKVGQQHVLAANRSAAAARTDAVAANDEKAAVLADVVMTSHAWGTTHNDSSGTSSLSSEGTATNVNEVWQIVHDAAKAAGIGERQAAAILFGASGHFGLHLPNIPGQPVALGGQVSGSVDKNYSADATTQLKKLESFLSNEQHSKIRQFSDTINHNAGLIDSMFSDHKTGSDLSARYSKAVSKSTRAEANYRVQKQLSETVEGMFSRGESYNKDLLKDPDNRKDFENLIHHEEGGSAAEKVKLESFLGNISNTPALPSNQNLPGSFNDVRKEYDTLKKQEDLNPNVEAVYGKDKGKVLHQSPDGDDTSKERESGKVADGAVTSKKSPAGSESIVKKGNNETDNGSDRKQSNPDNEPGLNYTSKFRDSVKKKANEIDADVKKNSKEVADQTPGVDKDGHLVVKKSQLKAAGAMVVNDIESTAENLRDMAAPIRKFLSPGEASEGHEGFVEKLSRQNESLSKKQHLPSVFKAKDYVEHSAKKNIDADNKITIAKSTEKNVSSGNGPNAAKESSKSITATGPSSLETNRIKQWAETPVVTKDNWDKLKKWANTPIFTVKLKNEKSADQEVVKKDGKK